MQFVAGGPNPGRRFVKGQSGNPRGRSKSIIQVAALARQYSPKAIKLLAEVMEREDAPLSSRITAAIALLDRGCGKPAQAVDLIKRELDARQLRALPDDELIAIIGGATAEPVAATNGSDGTADTPPDPPVPH